MVGLRRAGVLVRAIASVASAATGPRAYRRRRTVPALGNLTRVKSKDQGIRNSPLPLPLLPHAPQFCAAGTPSSSVHRVHPLPELWKIEVFEVYEAYETRSRRENSGDAHV